ncbi:hypothetical protein [Streptomyces sp. NPDC050704]|uniref:hypothetical protein n=1 Tax=Streptomyces sp. NPDC050704 TaxID=3157219 RepID=UPI003446078E
MRGPAAHRSFRRPALLFATAFLLSSCGIPSTGVVEAGEGATGIRASRVLYFVRAGTLIAVQRPTSDPIGVDKSVVMLFGGPEARERATGVTTELPPVAAIPMVRTDGARVSVELSRDTRPLTTTAAAQVICTAAAALLLEAPDTDPASTKVTVTAPGAAWRTEGSAERCPAIADIGASQRSPANPEELPSPAPSST